jgi:hypothetical protein
MRQRPRCRVRRAAVPCAGYVQYFLLVTPRHDFEQQIRACGLPFKGPMRFAICNVYSVEEVGYKMSPRFLSHGIGKQMSDALVHSQCCASPTAVKDLINRAQESAAVFRCGAAKVPLGGLTLWPIPLDREWMSTDWEVTPMVSIRPDRNSSKLSQVGPTRNTASSNKVAATEFRKAVSRNCSQYRYFTQSYTLSTLGADEYEAPDTRSEDVRAGEGM